MSFVFVWTHGQQQQLCWTRAVVPPEESCSLVLHTDLSQVFYGNTYEVGFIWVCLPGPCVFSLSPLHARNLSCHWNDSEIISGFGFWIRIKPSKCHQGYLMHVSAWVCILAELVATAGVALLQLKCLTMMQMSALLLFHSSQSIWEQAYGSHGLLFGDCGAQALVQ